MNATTLVSINGVVGDFDREGQSPLPMGSGISPLDRGLLYGDGIMETILVKERQPILPHAHLERLREGAERMGMPVPWSDEELMFEMDSLMSLRPFPWAYLRILLTAGFSPGLWSPARGATVPQRILYYGPYEETPEKAQSSQRSGGNPHESGGCEGVLGLKIRRKIAYHYSYQPRIKTNNYIHEVMALNQAAKEGFDDILWTREDGEVLEASAANIFFMARQGDLLEIVTPPATCGILPGVTRKKMIELLTAAGIPVTEQKIYFDEIPRFDEAFLTSSLAGLRPIGSIDRQRLHTVRPQATFWHLKRLYRTWLDTYQE